MYSIQSSNKVGNFTLRLPIYELNPFEIYQKNLYDGSNNLSNCSLTAGNTYYMMFGATQCHTDGPFSATVKITKQ
jgi:hypothetical protein